MILVTGSTGNVGREVVRELAARNVKFRALVRKQTDIESLSAQGIDAVLGDSTNPESMRAVLEDVDHLYVLSPASPQLAEFESALIDEARKAGVQHIVKHSIMGADSQSTCLFLKSHGQVEEVMKASGIPYTFLRPNSFMQNLVLSNARSIAASGAFYDSLGDARVSYVDTRDIGAVAAQVLTEEGHEGRTYDLTGPEALSNAEIAAKLSSLLGKEVKYISVSDEMAQQSMLSVGMPDWLVDGLISLSQLYRQGGGASVTQAVEQVTGHKPRTMNAYLEENIQAFREQ